MKNIETYSSFSITNEEMKKSAKLKSDKVKEAEERQELQVKMMDLHEEITELRQLLEDPSIPSSRPADRGEEKKIIKAAITKLEKEYDKMSDEFDNKFGKKYWGIF